MKKILLFLSFLLMSFSVYSAKITLSLSDFPSLTSSYTSSSIIKDDVTFNYVDFIKSTDYIQVKASSGAIYNSTAFPGNITEIKLTHKGTARSTTICYGTTEQPTTNSSTFDGSTTISVTGSNRYFKITRGGNAAYWENIEITYDGSEPTKYTVLYNANGGTGTIIDSSSPYVSGATVTVLSNTFTRSNYIFDRWNTANDGSGTYYSAGNTFTINANITLYAQWLSVPVYIDTTYMLVPIDSLTSDDIFIIVGKKEGNYYAMTNNNVKESPGSVMFNPISDFIFTDSTIILWKLSGDNENGFIFYPYNDNEKWLYCNTTASSSNNDNLKIGTDVTRNKFIYGLNSKHYLETKDNYTTRFLGVINNSYKWHSYIDTIGAGGTEGGTAQISDESFYFYKLISNVTEFHTACVRVFNNAENDSTWTNRGNWIFNKLPDDSIYGARIDTAVLVDTTHAVAKHVIINQNTGNGKIIIQPNKGLEVDSTVVVSKNNSYHPTTPNDLILESSDAGNASLIFNNSNQNSATVNLYSKATYPGLDGVNADWQYIGTSITSLNALYNYYGSWLYEWVGEPNKWQAVPNGGTMKEWKGYCITQREEACHETSGQLVATNGVVELPIDSPHTVVANSWTAPIHISKFADDDFYNLSDKRVYLFNTGFDPGGDGAVHENRYNSPGTYVVIPIHAASYLDKDSLIPSQQGFFVKTNKKGTLKLDYNKLVRTGGSGLITAGALRAPKRVVSDDKPNVLKIYAHGSKFSDRLTILEREDFSTGFDNGWDGDKMSFSNLSPSIYVINQDGSYDEVSAIPNYEGTVLGFKSGSDSICRLTFSYDGDDTWYLNDLVTLTSTLIDSDSEYVFTHDSENDVRFIISATPYAGVATDIYKVSDGENSVHKYLHNGNLYIIKNNRIFNAIGSLIQ